MQDESSTEAKFKNWRDDLTKAVSVSAHYNSMLRVKSAARKLRHAYYLVSQEQGASCAY